MGIIGIGCDIEETARFLKHLNSGLGDAFARRLYTEGELEYCLSSPHPEQRLAARFCAKEAFFKALGTGVAGGLSMADAEVRRDASGRPWLELHGLARERAAELGVAKIFLALSHTDAYAQAVVVLEGAD